MLSFVLFLLCYCVMFLPFDCYFMLFSVFSLLAAKLDSKAATTAGRSSAHEGVAEGWSQVGSWGGVIRCHKCVLRGVVGVVGCL